jgi:hypothetical protein
MNQIFDNSINKIESITESVMSKIVWEEIKPPKFHQKDEGGEESVSLLVPFREKSCYIEFEISEENKQELKKMSL